MGEKSVRKHVRVIGTWISLGLIAACAFGPIGQWFIQVATDKGWYRDAGHNWDRIMSGVTAILTSPYLTLPTIFFVGGIAGMWLDLWLIGRGAKKTTQLEMVSGQKFLNERVQLDGKHYVGCEFTNVTFTYAGDDFKLDRCTIRGAMIEPLNESLGRLTTIYHQFGMLKVSVRDRMGEIPISSSFTGQK